MDRKRGCWAERGKLLGAGLGLVGLLAGSSACASEEDPMTPGTTIPNVTGGGSVAPAIPGAAGMTGPRATPAS